MSEIPGWGTKIPQAMWHDQKKKKKNGDDGSILLQKQQIGGLPWGK